MIQIMYWNQKERPEVKNFTLGAHVSEVSWVSHVCIALTENRKASEGI